MLNRDIGTWLVLIGAATPILLVVILLYRYRNSGYVTRLPFSGLTPSLAAEWERAKQLRAADRRAAWTALLVLMCISAFVFGGTLSLINQKVSPDGSNELSRGARLVCAAAATRFILSYAEMVQRLARSDLNGSCVSMALRQFFHVLVAATAGAFMLSASLESNLTMSSRLTAFYGVGLAVGLMGDGVVQAARSAVTVVFSHATSSEDDLESLARIDGIGAEEQARLAEAGVRGRSTLADASTGRLYAMLPYDLGTILRWQDQALLFDRIGVQIATQLRAAAISTISELAFATEHTPERLSHLDATLIHRVDRNDPSVARIIMWRGVHAASNAQVSIEVAEAALPLAAAGVASSETRNKVPANGVVDDAAETPAKQTSADQSPTE